jgi:hypothetical protein
MLFVPLLLMGKNRRYRDTVATITLPDGTIKTKWMPSLKEAGQMLLTFALAVLGWIIFRAENIGQVGEIVSTILSGSILNVPMLISQYYYIPLFVVIIVMLLFEWFTRNRLHGLEITNVPYRWIRWSIYMLIILALFFSIKTETPQFIYFQF